MLNIEVVTYFLPFDGEGCEAETGSSEHELVNTGEVGHTVLIVFVNLQQIHYLNGTTTRIRDTKPAKQIL